MTLANSWILKIFQPGGLGYLFYALIILVIAVFALWLQLKKGIEDWRKAKTIWAAIEEVGMCGLILVIVYVFSQVDPVIVLNTLGEIIGTLWSKAIYPFFQMILKSLG